MKKIIVLFVSILSSSFCYSQNAKTNNKEELIHLNIKKIASKEFNAFNEPFRRVCRGISCFCCPSSVSIQRTYIFFDVAKTASQASGVNLINGGISIMGAGPNGTAYYIDGVRVMQNDIMLLVLK